MEQARVPRGDGELVLVVDDEPSIRTIVRGTLERFGHRVLLANNGAEAVELYANRRDPSVKIVASSGLTTEASISNVMGLGATHFAPKPYTAETLLKTIKRAVITDETGSGT